MNVRASKSTIKRVLKSMKLTWRRIRRKVNDQPDPETYQQKREALEILIAEDQEGIIDLRYFDESGFCLVPYTYRSVIFGDKSQIALSSGDE